MPRRPPRPALLTFRVYPGARRGLFWRVRIFATQRDLVGYVRSTGRSTSPRLAGMCTPHQRIDYRGRRPRPSLEMGEILLCTGWLGGRTVSHEAAHAALHWGRRLGGLARVVTEDQPSKRGALLRDSPEEAFCYGLGEIVRQIYDRLERSGILELQEVPRHV